MKIGNTYDFRIKSIMCRMVDFMHKDKNWDKNYGENFKNYHTFLFIWYIMNQRINLLQPEKVVTALFYLQNIGKIYFIFLQFCIRGNTFVCRYGK
jgi:hypothetical protein